MQYFRSRLSGALIIFCLAISLASCGSQGTQSPSAQKSARQPTLVLMTDYGTANDAVAICKAVILNIVPDVRIMDITNQVTPFSIEDGARFLYGVSPYYPSGTVFLVVVDPGVGTSRKAVIVKTKKGQYFDLPDNGLITPVIDRDGLDSAREITNPAWMLPHSATTFDGRDIFSPSAAHLVAGEDWTQVGPVVNSLVRLAPRAATIDQKGITGEVIALDDPFGSLITDIQGDDFKKLGYSLGEKVKVTIDKRSFTMPYAKAFMDVPVGQPLLYVDSRGRIGLALNERNFSATYKVTPPVSVYIPRKSE